MVVYFLHNCCDLVVELVSFSLPPELQFAFA